MTWWKTTRVAIITEGTEETGFGHIIRCSSLYEAFLDASDDPLFIINGNASILSIVKSCKHLVFDWLVDRDRCKKILHDFDVVIIDSYLAGRDFYDEIAPIARVKVYIDDNKRIDFPDGIILNGAIYAMDLGYPVKGKHGNLIGPRFFMLRKPFQARHQKIINKKLTTVMIVFGATDIRNMTPGVLDFLHKNFPKLKKKVVLGPGFQDQSNLNESGYSNIDFLKNVNAQGMFDLMIESDLAISACGTTLYELACLGVPTIGIGVADNQILNVKNFSQTGFLRFAGWWNELTLFKNLLSSIRAMVPQEVRTTASRVGQDLVKGMGTVDVVKHVKAAWLQEKLVFSKASKPHCDLLYKWANDSEVRKNSFNAAQIPYETHVKWFEEKLGSKNSHIFIGHIDSTPVGQLRIDVEDMAGVISYNIDKEWRGKGLGTVFLLDVSELIANQHINVDRLVGKVKAGNVQSQKAFEKAGFRKSDENGYLKYSKDL